MKKSIFILCICLFACSACSVQKEDGKRLREVPFTVVDEQNIPEELKVRIEEEKEEKFEITYGDQGYLYIAKGYGVRDTSGYSIEVEDCYETEDTIQIKTNLLGPPKEEETVNRKTFPYIVIKTEYSEKYVEFD